MKKVLKHIKLSLAALFLAAGFVAAGTGALAYAAPSDVLEESCARGNNANSALCEGSQEENTLFGPGGLFTNIVNVIIFMVGAVAVVMIVIGGFKYTVSGGDQSAVTSAKNTILYAIVGVVVALLSYAIVNFVITRF